MIPPDGADPERVRRSSASERAFQPSVIVGSVPRARRPREWGYRAETRRHWSRKQLVSTFIPSAANRLPLHRTMLTEGEMHANRNW